MCHIEDGTTGLRMRIHAPHRAKKPGQFTCVAALFELVMYWVFESGDL